MNDFAAGARNLLMGCGGLVPGNRVLIVSEPGGQGHYDPALAPSLARAAADLGLDVQQVDAPFRAAAALPDAALIDAMRVADLSVFLARLGDQIRFRTLPDGVRGLVCYALDCDQLAGAFGQVAHAGMMALHDLLDRAVFDARAVHVTCPAGTDFRGAVAPDATQPSDTTTLRFPLSVHSPVPAAQFSGRVAQRGFLVGTGSNYYEPYAVALHDTLFVTFQDNRITGFEGCPEDMQTAQSHYDRVAAEFGIDAMFVHSWHSGIHPGSAFAQAAGANFERWTCGAFGNPRLLHLHTCGAYAPGEISLNILDPTVTLDGVAVWDKGRLCPDRIAGGAEVLAQFSDLGAAIDAPAQACGQGASGGLSFA